MRHNLIAIRGCKGVIIVFQTRLKELREAAGYKSQQAFADVFGVAQSTVGGWEAGKREPNYETTMRLARFFGVSVDDLLGLEDKKETLPTESEERRVPDGYDQLTAANRMIVDRLIVDLAKSQLNQ